MAIIAESRRRCRKIASLASRLGATANRVSRISTVETAKRTFQFLRFVQTTKPRVPTSATFAEGKDFRIEGKTNTEAVTHFNRSILPQSIYWCLCDETLYRANIRSVQKPSFVGQSDRNHEFHRQLGQCGVYVLDSFHRQTRSVFNGGNWRISQLTCDNLLWLLCPTERIYFFRASTSNTAIQQQRFGVDSDDLSHSLEFFLVLFIHEYAVDNNYGNFFV